MDEKSIRFRKCLVEIAQAMRKNDLDAMKYMCKDIIPRRRLEEIESGTDLWVALEERGLLDADNVAYLRELLVSAVENRTDLVNLLDNYERTFGKYGIIPNSGNARDKRQSKEEFIGEDLTKEFDYIVDHIGRNWRPLARKLDLTDTDIECIIEENQRNLKEQSRKALIQWKRDKKEAATREALISALQLCDLNDTAYHIGTMFMPSN